ncbi:M3 family oligoendopeptidase [Candidatus Endowatersipora endosymbiont of Watersipora subatra]|uniref:M3 family oligoendopeptidase n=1 Tax=Candidatus Endowatersipora endosymbiont of Watersipora subatra TaxID=3077946 RepID=UPI00312C9F23
MSNTVSEEQDVGVENSLGKLPEWNLGDLYPGMDSELFGADFKNSIPKALAFEKAYKGHLLSHLQSSADQLANIIVKYEKLQDFLGRISAFSVLLYSENSSDPKRIKFYGDVQEKVIQAVNHLTFFSLELNKIEDETLDSAFSLSSALAFYRPWLLDLRIRKPYQLDDNIEQLFIDKEATSHLAFNRLFDETISRLRFEVNRSRLPIEPALALLQDQQESTRKKASDALALTFKDNLPLFTLITNTLAKDKQISDSWRGFEDVADSRHLANRVEPSVIDALVIAVQDALPHISHRYYTMKAKWLGLQSLNHWDRNAPLPKSFDSPIPWSHAKDTVLKAYNSFAPEMGTIAERFFTHGWIDSLVRPGKAPGAFSHPTVPSSHPYISMNYQGKLRDVMTLAHELGHGIHQVLAAQQGALMASPPLILAETASVFGEMLTFQSLLNQTLTREGRKAILAAKVEDMINTVFRQIAFYLFERTVHKERRNGELTSDQLCQIWLNIQKESLGPSVRIGDGYETFWVYIPHFIHSPFYVYAYAFGDCLANSLYACYQDCKCGFQKKYFEMLKAGGTKHHKEILEPFGLDASDPGFWSQGLSVICSLIDDLDHMEHQN